MKGVRCWAMRWATASALMTALTRWLQELRWSAQTVVDKEEGYFGGIENMRHHCWQDTDTVVESAWNHPDHQGIESFKDLGSMDGEVEDLGGWMLPDVMCLSVLKAGLKAIFSYVCFIVFPLVHIAV